MDDHFLRVTGSANIEAPLDIDTDYEFAGKISVYNEDKSSKQNGEYKFTYKAQFIENITLIKGDKVILGQKGQSWSQKWRNLVISDGTDYDAFERWLFTKHDELKEEFTKSL